MIRIRAFITGVGIISPVGVGVASVRRALCRRDVRFKPLSLFEAGEGGPLPTGQVTELEGDPRMPRTHALALAAARQAVAEGGPAPDAVVLGGTTGGMPTTEALLLAGERDPARYALHATGSVADRVAQSLGCSGPALTISTACSSSAVALKVALEMLRTGEARRVLAGGVDGLCRLTYYGFALLQLVDPQGARPLDEQRAGMTVSEGAAMLLIQAAERPPPGALAELLGGGLSCDAHHATAPHPQGLGALAAMRAALLDAGVEPGEVDYLNLHGTGTRDNDASEARAVRALFGPELPRHSSTKGIFGHSLAAAGASEALVSQIAIEDGLVPPNARCAKPDPELGLDPVLEPIRAELRTVLSSSFGFGGNNAALVLGAPDRARPGVEARQRHRFSILCAACLSGAGLTETSFERFCAERSCAGRLDPAELVRDLPPRAVRRLKRLPRIVLALADAVCAGSSSPPVDQVYFGTGFGPLSETCDFLVRLFESPKRLSSPTDFVGSVHNAPAGQVAMRLGVRGANVTATGGDTSFEQALWMASLLATGDASTVLLIGADEGHAILSPILDRSQVQGQPLADGGGALLLSTDESAGFARLSIPFFQRADSNPNLVAGLIAALGGVDRIRSQLGAILVGRPKAERAQGQPILDALLTQSGFLGPVIDYRPLLGEFATCSACACALAAELVRAGRIPAALSGGATSDLGSRGILLLTLGSSVAAVEVAA